MTGRDLSNGGTTTVTNSTVTNNTVGTNGIGGGGIQNYPSATITLVNTIVAGNMASAGPDCKGSLSSLGHNLIGTGDGCSFTAVTGDLLNVDPKLGSPVRQRRPYADPCPATWKPRHRRGQPDDAGHSGGNACPVTDQRGVQRPVDGDGDRVARCDIGAFEFGTAAVRPVITKTEDTDGTCSPTDCSLREAIKAAQSGDTIVVPAGVYTLTPGQGAGGQHRRFQRHSRHHRDRVWGHHHPGSGE